MNTIITSFLVLSLLPIVCAWVSGYHRQKQLGKVDNKEPRVQSAQLTGPGARAVAAQANCWEALIVFSAAILAVYISGIALEEVANLALVYTALRIIYVPLYIGNIDKLRSLVFLGGFGICIYMFYLALNAN